MKKNYRILLYALTTIFISIVIIASLNKKVNPYAQVSYNISVDSIKTLTLEILKDQNITVNKNNISVGLAANKNMIGFTQKKHGITKSAEKFKDEVPGYYWNVSIDKDNEKSAMFSGNKEQIVKAILGQINISFTLNGNLIGYEINIDDSAKTNTLTYNEAFTKVKVFLEKHTKFNLSELDTIKHDKKQKEKSISISLSPKGIDSNVSVKEDNLKRGNYVFEGKSFNSGLNDTIKVKVSLIGNYITNFSLHSDKVDKIESDKVEVAFEIASIAVYFIVLIAMIIAAFKRYRAYEIGFRTAIIIGSLGGLAVIFNFVFVRMPLGWEILLPIVFGFLFSFGGYIIITAVAESYTREIWNEKLISLDLITNGYFFHNKIGKAILRGVSFGLAVVAVYFTLLYAFSFYTNYSLIVLKEEVFIIDQILSVFYPFVKAVNNILFPIIIIFLAIGTFLRSRTKNRNIFILTTALIWAIVAHDTTSPIFLGIIIQFIIGIIISTLMWKYDFFTILITLFTAYSSIIISWFALVPETEFILQIILCSLVILLGIIALFSKYRLDDLNKITPKFQKHISERQRLQGELSVARDVQMSFLPQKSPLFERLEIAARCLPAYEVGGDYYDFIRFSDKKIGIAIGDVSGKGTKAAFYMTLTKGFLKATSRFNTSPSQLLTDMNSMFYENVERGNFISMIFTLIDTENNSLTFSRAGHNPLIYKRPNLDCEILKPTGIALGLEKGDVFSKTITEQQVNIGLGDFIIMFTDGVTEAENSKGEEYGMDKLVDIINSNKFNNANELLETVYKDVHKFTGKTAQHDDMTMIVIRVI